VDERREPVEKPAPDGGRSVDGVVENHGRGVDIVWITAGVVFASVAIGCSVFFAWMAGSLTPTVGILGLSAGAVAGALSLRSLVRSGLAADRQSWGLWDGLALAAFAAASIRQFGWILFERDGALLTLLPYNYGDLPLHWTYVQHLAAGAPFWPETPILAHERLRYPFGVDLLTAVFVQLGPGMRVLLPVMGLAGAALAALWLRRWGGAFAVAGFLFAGGLAGLQALLTGQVTDYQSAVAWKSLFLALFVPQRGFLLALPAGLLLLWSWRRRFVREGEPPLPAWVEGVVWGALPLVHLHTFAFVSLVFAAWAVAGGRLRAGLAPFAWAVLPAVWATWQVTDRFSAASLVGFRPGWMIGGEGPLVFLALNFGLLLPVALAALWVAARERGQGLVLLGPPLLVFALLFVVKLAPWEWDNTKVMLWCYVALLPPVFDLALARFRPPWRAATLVALFFSGAVSVLGASRGDGPRLEVLDRAEYEGVCAALRGVATGRIASAPTFNHPVALCGRPIVAGYAGHLWSHGLDARATEAGLKRLMRGEPGWREAARGIDASHVYWGPREAAAFPDSSRPWAASGPPAASGPWGALYRVE
jgi:hypothetical protein